MKTGNLIVKPLTARLELDTSAILPMDPYVKVICGKHEVNSSVATKEGKTPTWNEQLFLRVEDCDFIVFQVWDKNKFDKDDLIGEGKLTFTRLEAFPEGYQDWIQLKSGEVEAGGLLVDVRFQADPVLTKSASTGGTQVFQEWSEHCGNTPDIPPIEKERNVLQGTYAGMLQDGDTLPTCEDGQKYNYPY